MAFLFDMFAPAMFDAAGNAFASSAASTVATSATNSVLAGAATAGTAALLTDKPDIKFPEVKGPGHPTPPPGAPMSPSDTAAVQRARLRAMPKSTMLTKPAGRSKNVSVSRATLSGGGET